MPATAYSHCMALLNETTALVIGGYVGKNAINQWFSVVLVSDPQNRVIDNLATQNLLLHYYQVVAQFDFLDCQFNPKMDPNPKSNFDFGLAIIIQSTKLVCNPD
jgi:hypothetical protein